MIYWVWRLIMTNGVWILEWNSIELSLAVISCLSFLKNFRNLIESLWSLLNLVKFFLELISQTCIWGYSPSSPEAINVEPLEISIADILWLCSL